VDERGKLTVICGHYGSGKTNFAMNYAINAAKNGNNVTLADMDIVNPYFTSSEYTDVLEKNGVKVISPVFARTNMEITALPASMYSIFDTDGDVMIDAGGDDAGATVLGRFADKIKERGYEMIYVTNMYRPSTSDPEDSVSVLREIENACGLKATAVVNNSHLKNESTASLITDSLSYGKEVARLAHIPLMFTTVPFSLKESMPKDEYFYPVAVYVGTIWETVSEDAEDKH
jgi:MinD-like ATPase involved in chromosome partitioning or flagellar assembly